MTLITTVVHVVSRRTSYSLLVCANVQLKRFYATPAPDGKMEARSVFFEQGFHTVNISLV